jgi:four helix bundle protein
MENQIKTRTKRIGIDIINLVDELPGKLSVFVISKQILRCSTSVGANYRAACRARSDADFLNKLRIIEEESDETAFWLEILEEANLIEPAKVQMLKKEVNEITSIMVASQKTMQNKINLKNRNRMKG